MIGSMLISALIIFPALTSMKLFKKFKTVILSSAILSIFNFTLGMIISVVVDTPVGATIVVTDIMIFLIFGIIGKIMNK